MPKLPEKHSSTLMLAPITSELPQLNQTQADALLPILKKLAPSANLYVTVDGTIKGDNLNEAYWQFMNTISEMGDQLVLTQNIGSSPSIRHRPLRFNLVKADGATSGMTTHFWEINSQFNFDWAIGYLYEQYGLAKPEPSAVVVTSQRGMFSSARDRKTDPSSLQPEDCASNTL